MLFSVCSLLLILLSSCGRYSLRKIDPERQAQRFIENATLSDNLSRSTSRFLLSQNVKGSCNADLLLCILELDSRFRYEKSATLALHLSELSFHHGKQYSPESDRFIRLNASSLVYASSYLFDESLLERPGPYDSGRSLAIQLYNQSLSQLIRSFEARRTLTSGRINIPLIRGELQIQIRPDLDYLPPSFLNVRVASDYEAQGLSSYESQQGVGTALIVIRPFDEQASGISSQEPLRRLDGSADDPGNRADNESDPNLLRPSGEDGQRIPEARKLAAEQQRRQELNRKYQFLGEADQAYPGTALFRLQGSLLDENLRISAELDLHNSLRTSRARMGGIEVPLSVDLTTPMAYMLSGAEDRDSLWRRLDGDDIGESSGLYMLYPYDSEKIPVVFVHGLVSSPMTWFKMINELIQDTTIRERFQFWVYWYPTSNPVTVSGHGLRKTLKQVHGEYGFERMVLVGHSMGGLLSRLMIQQSTLQDWTAESKIETAALEALEEQTRTLIRQITTYEPLPFISRVVFIATPHRGSTMADGFAGYIGRQLMALPSEVAGLVENTLGPLLGSGTEDVDFFSLSGIDSLSPDSLFVRVSMKQPLASRIPYHSIIGSRSLTDLDWITDSVVPYASSHLPGATSELLIESDHSVHERLPAILEVRRILKLELE